uniref:Uncharacterized protein n=1 Tax=Rhizophora mucronata TaxID=61149 RepID=A0A2P2R020_RHIMU
MQCREVSSDAAAAVNFRRRNFN